MSYACKWCEYIVSEEYPDADHKEMFALLTAHQREEHPEERKAGLGRPAKSKKASQKSQRLTKVEGDEVSPSERLKDGDVKVRLTNEQISLPGELFVLYTWIKTQFPEYTATKADWLQHVVATWAIEHAEEINLPAIPGAFIGNALNLEEGEVEDGEDDTEEQSVSVADRYQPGEEDGQYQPLFS